MTQRSYVFAKPPRPGLSKTRLAASMGDPCATALAVAFLDDTCSRLVQRGLHPVLATTEPDADFGMAQRYDRIDQGTGSLGDRIERVLALGLTHGDVAWVMGADSPGLPDDRFASMNALLASCDAAMIPALDGGFVALAVRRLPEQALADVPWSSPQTCARAKARLEQAGLTVGCTEPWFDIDVEADLELFRAQVPVALAPATWQVLDAGR